MLQVNNLSKHFSDQTLFKDISFNLSPGERVGLVGRNGSGKSTLFSLILGKQLPDSGTISLPNGYTISNLEQHIQFSKETVLEECTQELSKDEQYDFHKVEKILFGLGFTQEDLEKSPLSFSGGYQIRINLCKALIKNPNLLLLDEPTNYLDILSLRWLRSFLRTFPGEVIIITHDRDFMDSVSTHTMGIYRQGLKKIKGSTHKFYEQMKLEDEIYEKTRINTEKKREHLESFVERFSAKASKATQAQSKQKQLDKLTKMDQLESESQMNLQFQHQECPGKVLMDIKDLSFGFQEDQLLFKDLNFHIGRQDRIGIIGKNGKGKSTLLNVIAKELSPITGSISEHPKLKKGHFGQTNVKRLFDGNTIIEEIQSENTDLPTTSVRNICGSLMFEGELAKKKISVLSGGEKNRVLLGKIIANPTNLLLLDEPTNHLDMESIDVLKEELKRYPGAVLVVTHSEELLREVCDKLIIFHEGRAEYFLGGYNEFLEKVGWEEEAQDKKKEEKPTLTKKEIHAKRSEIIKERSKLCNPLKKNIEKFETKIIELEEKLEAVNNDLLKATEESNNDLILEASRSIGEIEAKIQNAFEQLEENENELVKHNEFFDAQLEELN